MMPQPSPLQDPVKQTLAKTIPALLQVIFVFTPIISVLVLSSSLYMMQVFDRVLTGQSLSTLFYLTIIAVGATAMLAVLELVRSRMMSRIGNWIESRLTAEALSRAVEASLLGREYRTEMLRDLAVLRNFFANPATLNLFDSPFIIIYLLVVYYMHPTLGFITAAGAVGLALLAWFNDRVTQGAMRESGIIAQKTFRQAESAIRNAEVIDVMGMMPGLLHRWRSDNDRVQELQLSASDRAGNVMAFTKFVRLGLQIFVMAVGVVLVLHRELTSGGMIACSIIISRALSPIESSIGSWRYNLVAWQSFLRLREIFSRPMLRNSSMQLPAPRGHLTVEGVSYAPPGAKAAIIKGVSFEIKPGTVTAMVGPSAAGKSTLARLCVGAYLPGYGNVRLDGADVFLWERADFGQYVGYLPQDVELFSGTIRDNISRLLPATPAEVVEAAQLAGAHELILRLPQGYETEIGDGGAFLSGGQRQRIGLARALFRNPQFVVLDEPNSSLDGEGEDALNRAILSLKDRGATVLLIGHRPSILAHVDNLIVLREGRIEMMGPKSDIMSKIMPAPQRVTERKPQPAGVV